GGPMMRATVSTVPPGGKPTNIRMGRSGKDCAQAGMVVAVTPAAAISPKPRLVNMCEPSVPFLYPVCSVREYRSVARQAPGSQEHQGCEFFSPGREPFGRLLRPIRVEVCGGVFFGGIHDVFANLSASMVGPLRAWMLPRRLCGLCRRVSLVRRAH